MSEIEALTELAAQMREVAVQIHEPGTSPVSKFQTAVLFELPKPVRDPDLRMLELELLQFAGRIESYLRSRRYAT
jgi:hypothetical protein